MNGWLVFCFCVCSCLCLCVLCVRTHSKTRWFISRGLSLNEYTCATSCRIAEDEQIHALHVFLFSFWEGLFQNQMPFWKNKKFKMHYVFLELQPMLVSMPTAAIAIKASPPACFHHLHFLCCSSLFNIWR